MTKQPKNLVKQFDNETSAVAFAKNFIDYRGLARFGVRQVLTTYNHPLDAARVYTVTVSFAGTALGRKLAKEWSK